MKIELLEIFGNDEMVVNAARVSYGKDATNYTSGENKSLINYLASHGHTSPFRHPQIQYRITCPIYVERQLFKHQVGLTANSISGRYVDFSDTYTKVNVWRKQSKSSKLRIDANAQAETRYIAMEMLHELKLTNKFILSLEAFHL
jgi:thymidylate synthase (FAD)